MHSSKNIFKKNESKFLVAERGSVLKFIYSCDK